MTETDLTPMRDVSRDDPFAPQDRRCPICGVLFASRRARYCSGACRMKALRRRRYFAAQKPSNPAPVGQPEWQPVYECSGCGERLLGNHRCPDCNRFGRRLGLGGPCPHCDEPVLLTDLAGRGADR